ncbi:MAG TPA: hypothetical protein VFC03_18075 [Acidimicrobiales bacterium]|nr:hypothetical protein [Acidimicrobiales bacterium]
MTLFIIMVPLMVAAVLIATVPVLYYSVRENRLIHSGSADKPKPDMDNRYFVRKVTPAQRQQRQVKREKVAT